MVLRSGIIIPFQFRDSKKLLMVGVPGENRNLNIWDLRNVVRAAFGIYNFEFRNKKIGFNIPDELLLHYLAQRHDLTNFVIEIGQDPSVPTSDNGMVAPPTTDNFVASNNNLQINENSHIPEVSRQEFRNPFEGENAFTSANEALDKGCGVYQEYTDQNERSKLHLIAEKHLNSKSEQIERKIEQIQKTKEHAVEVTHAPQDQQQQHQQQQRESPLFSQRPPFEYRGETDVHIKKVDYQQNPFAACAMNRFRIYDPCKDNFNSMGGCSTCHGPPPEQKPTLNVHENTNTSTYHSGVGGSRCSASAASPQNSQNANELPTLKMRMSHGNNILSTHEVSHMEIEPKIDYDAGINTAGSGNTDAEDSTPPPMTVHVKTNLYADEDQQQQQQQQQDFHLERLQHEYALQQQHHFEAFMQENSSGNSLRQRKERMSKKQKEIYVHFLEQNPIINEHRRSDPILDPYWIKLADILNTVPQGAIKHVAEWKQTFDNWRYRVFLYARYNSKVTGPDALNPKSFKPLTHTDKRAYHIWIRNPDTAPPDLEKMRNVFVNLEETQQE